MEPRISVKYGDLYNTKDNLIPETIDKFADKIYTIKRFESNSVIFEGQCSCSTSIKLGMNGVSNVCINSVTVEMLRPVDEFKT